MSAFHSLESLKSELSCVVKEEANIVAFKNLLELIRNFSNKDIDTRTRTLIDLSFWKGELDNRKRLSEVYLRKQDALAYNEILDELKKSAMKYNEETVKNRRDAKDMGAAYQNMLDTNLTCTKWVGILTDCYFSLNSINKILENKM